MHQLKVFHVGGAVRDQYLNLPNSDQDFVVVGSTTEEMLSLGFKQVGSDFPVFLHPETQDEYALARTERKTAPGYAGFTVHATPEVTLEEDLSRRDFTMNAMAMDENGQLIDPFNGRADLDAGILRHVSSAFSEDPVRILRAARFAARFGFTVAPETLELMRFMVNNGEVDALVAERVWQELSRALMEKKPSLFFTTLRDCGALAKILPEVDALFGVPQPAKHHPEIDCGIHVMMVVDDAAKQGYALEVRFAALVHDLGKATTPADVLPSHHGHEIRSKDLARDLCERLRVPADCRELGLIVAEFHTHVHRGKEIQVKKLVDFLQRCDVWRRPARFTHILQACASDARGRTGHEDYDYVEADFMMQVFNAAKTVNAGEIALKCEDKSLIADKIRQARISAVKRSLKAVSVVS
jgi:tRNA nucleotidyltransferase (CCA-adding enzyme)